MPHYFVSTDKALLDVRLIHDYLATESYWAQGMPEDLLRTAIDNSFCFGLYEGGSQRQVGFARVITDHATFAYLCDVFIVTAEQGNGLGKQLIAAVMAALEPLGLRRITLATRDAHGLYRPFGFSDADQGRYMDCRLRKSYRE